MCSKDHEITFYSLVTAITRSVMFCGSGMYVLLCKRCMKVGNQFFYFITMRIKCRNGHPQCFFLICCIPTDLTKPCQKPFGYFSEIYLTVVNFARFLTFKVSFFSRRLSVTCDRSVVFSSTLVSSTNKTDLHDITEKLLKLALHNSNPTQPYPFSE